MQNKFIKKNKICSKCFNEPIKTFPTTKMSRIKPLYACKKHLSEIEWLYINLFKKYDRKKM